MKHLTSFLNKVHSIIQSSYRRGGIKIPMNTIKFIITSTTIGNKLFQPPSKYQLTEDTTQEEFISEIMMRHRRNLL